MANIFVRITDIISANINEMIDRVEDPELMIKQIIREMEENIRKARDGVLEAITSEKQLEKELNHHRKQVDEWKLKAETALRSGKEELARKALIRKKEHEKIVKDLEISWEAAHQTSKSLKAQLKTLENKLDEAKRKRTTLAARQRAAEAREYMGSTINYIQKGMRADEKFDRMEDKVLEIEARAEAVKELYDQEDDLEKEFDELEIDTDVESEFAELKKQIEKEKSSL